MNPLTCAHLDCPNEPTHRQVVRTPLMPAPAFYYVCAEHAEPAASALVATDASGAVVASVARNARITQGADGLWHVNANGLLDPHDPYSYADVTIGQTQHTEG